MVSWMSALKEFNKINGGKWCIPKRGSEDYNKVKRIMGKESVAEDKPKITAREIKNKLRDIKLKKYNI
jgi:hypothetical protein